LKENAESVLDIEPRSIRQNKEFNENDIEEAARIFGHVRRRDGLENLCFIGKVEGTIARGRKREKYLDVVCPSAYVGECFSNRTATQ